METNNQERKTVPYYKFTFEVLDRMAKREGYTGWEDENHVGRLTDTVGDLERYRKDRCHTIVDNANGFIYMAYGSNGDWLFNNLTSK